MQSHVLNFTPVQSRHAFVTESESNFDVNLNDFLSVRRVAFKTITNFVMLAVLKVLVVPTTRDRTLCLRALLSFRSKSKL